MTPERKAKQLVESYHNYINYDMQSISEFKNPFDDKRNELVKSDAKVLALSLVTQIISLPVYWDGTVVGKRKESDIDFWEIVKQEIIKL
jgi:hypothetical protein